MTTMESLDVPTNVEGLLSQQPDVDQPEIKEEPKEPEEVNYYGEVEVIEADAAAEGEDDQPVPEEEDEQRPSPTPAESSQDLNNNHAEGVPKLLLDDSGRLSLTGSERRSSLNGEKDRVRNINMRTASIHRPASSSKAASLPKNLLLLVPLLLSVFGYFCVGSAVFREPAAKTGQTPSNFSSLLKSLQTNYPGQRKHFWNNLIAAYDTSIVQGRDPSIVLLIHDQARATQAGEFLKSLITGVEQLAKTKTSRQSIFDLKTGELAEAIRNRDDDRAKLLLDEKLESVYMPGGRVSLVKNLQELPGKPALLFFTYGDDESTCKFKGVMLFLTLEVDSAQVTSYGRLVDDERELNTFAQKHLVNLWRRQLDVDSQIKPLLTRIGNIVLIFN